MKSGLSRKLLLQVALTLLFAGSIFLPSSLFAQSYGEAERHELGFWLGASTPLSAGGLGDQLNSTIGGGIFYRVDWPWVLFTELGAGYASYESRTTQRLNLAPVYGAFSYQLPLPFKLNLFVKAGGGQSSVEIQPENKSQWEPLYYGGLEGSLLASRSFRIGIRVDYFYIQESHLQIPKETQYYNMYYLAYRDADQSFDPRVFLLDDYRLIDGQVLNVSLMVSFYL